MKAFICKVFSFVKYLFLRLRVAVTLHIGHDGIEDKGKSMESNEEDSEMEDLL